MINVICVKHGTKYSVDYVNRLYNMISRHLTMPYKFYCFTEDPADINPNIIVREFPHSKFKGWWWKPYIFKQGLFPDTGVNFYIDLDMVIVKNIDKFMDYLPGQFLGLRDPGRVWRPHHQMLGSAVMRWPTNQFSDVWEKMESNPNLSSKFHGDQNYIYDLHKDRIVFYPDDWIRSYKWEVRTRSELLSDNSNFKEIRKVTLHTDTAILAFHGKPMVHLVKDPIIVDNWI